MFRARLLPTTYQAFQTYFLAAVRLVHSTPPLKAEAVSLLPWKWGLRKQQKDVEKESEVPDLRSETEAWIEGKKEKFIPVTRRSLLRRLGEEEGLLNWEERGLLERFAAALDARFSQRFQAILEEAKVVQ